MFFSVAAALAMLAPLVAAQTANFDAILTPSSGQTLTVGTTFKITWTASPAQYNNQPFSLTLIGGETQKSQVPLYTIGTGPANGVGEFLWKIPATDSGKPFYGIVISLLHNPAVFQYSMPFKIIGHVVLNPALAPTNSSVPTTEPLASVAASTETGMHTTKPAASTETGMHTTEPAASTETGMHTTEPAASTTITIPSTHTGSAINGSLVSVSGTASKVSVTDTDTAPVVTNSAPPPTPKQPPTPIPFPVTNPMIPPTPSVPSVVSNTTSSASGTGTQSPSSAAGRVVGGPLALLGLVAGAALAL